MAEPKGDTLAKAVGSLMAGKRAIVAKEQDLVRTLNAVLNKIGYQVVALGERIARRGQRRRRGRRGRPPGRKPGRVARVGVTRRRRSRKKR